MKIRGLNYLGVFSALTNPNLTLGELYQKYKDVDPMEWYDADDFIKITDRIEAKLGAVNLRKIGEKIMENLYPQFEEVGIKTPDDFIKYFVNLYDISVKGDEKGKWEIIEADPKKKRYLLKKTTPFNCIMEEGILRAGLRYFKGVIPVVKQTVCVKKGDDHCEYEIRL